MPHFLKFGVFVAQHSIFAYLIFVAGHVGFALRLRKTTATLCG